MSAVEIMQEIDKLSLEEQQKVFIQLTQKVVVDQGREPKSWLAKRLSFDEACDVVFRENRELLAALAR